MYYCWLEVHIKWPTWCYIAHNLSFFCYRRFPIPPYLIPPLYLRRRYISSFSFLFRLWPEENANIGIKYWRSKQSKHMVVWPSPPLLPHAQINPTLPLNTQQTSPAPYERRTTGDQEALCSWRHTRPNDPPSIVAAAHHLKKSPLPPPTFHSHHLIPSIIIS